MKRGIMIGVWIMIAGVLSTCVTTPLGFGRLSGVVFACGMLVAWLAGVLAAATWIAQRVRSTRNGSEP